MDKRSLRRGARVLRCGAHPLCAANQDQRRVRTNCRPWFLLALTAVSALSAACGTFEEKRIRELTHEKGFGSKAQGDATVENYVAGGDMVHFLMPPDVYQHPAARELYRLTLPQRVSLDGRIQIPYVGAVPVLGLTEAQLTTFVKGLLRSVFNRQIDLQADIIGESKNIYAFGETRMKGVVPMVAIGADATILKATASIGWTGLANLSRVYLIRPDAEHPLQVEVNLHEMSTTRYTAQTIPNRENDHTYNPP